MLLYIAPRFLICEDKDADQQCDNRAYDQPHCFCYLDPSPLSLYQSSEAALARLRIARYRFSYDGVNGCIRTIVLYAGVFDRLQHEFRTVDPCNL